MENPRLASEIVIGGIFGVMGAAFNQSTMGNAGTSLGASLIGSAISVWPLKSQEKFWTRETALTGLNITASSVVTHLVAHALIKKHHNHQPVIVYAPGYEGRENGWASRVAQGSDAEMSMER
ncbi:MAG: hypothetical protein ACN2B6_08125 [Rickettsiales bacterium]